MKRKTVSLCMIARDEEAHIGKAIKSALALVDEIVVVDTGSRDNTRIIAEGYGARIIDEVWQNDFAAARNTALGAATSDWILVLDCDEQLQSIRPVDFQRLLNDPGVIGYRFPVSNAGAAPQEPAPAVLRLFRNHPDVRYRYPVLEQIATSLNLQAKAEGRVVRDASLGILHDAGPADARSRKRDRNLRLLRALVRSCPDEPYFAYHLGRETLQVLDGEALPVAGLHTSAKYLEAAWRKVSELPRPLRTLVDFGPRLAGDYAAALRAESAPDRALTVIDEAQSVWGADEELLLQRASAALALVADCDDDRCRRQWIEVASRELRSLIADASTPTSPQNAVFVRGHRLLGDLALTENRVSEAAEAFEHALDLDQDCSDAWSGLAECARLAGDRKRALRLYLRAITANELNLRAWQRGCSLLDELGFHDNAESWRAKLQAQFAEVEPTETALV